MHSTIRYFVLALTLFTGIMSAGAQENKAAIHKAAITSALKDFSSGNPASFYQLFAGTYKSNQGGETLENTTRADTERFTEALLGAIPDLQLVPVVIIAQDDQVALEVTYSGTFTKIGRAHV